MSFETTKFYVTKIDEEVPDGFKEQALNFCLKYLSNLPPKLSGELFNLMVLALKHGNKSSLDTLALMISRASLSHPEPLITDASIIKTGLTSSKLPPFEEIKVKIISLGKGFYALTTLAAYIYQNYSEQRLPEDKNVPPERVTFNLDKYRFIMQHIGFDPSGIHRNSLMEAQRGEKGRKQLERIAKGEYILTNEGVLSARTLLKQMDFSLPPAGRILA